MSDQLDNILSKLNADDQAEVLKHLRQVSTPDFLAKQAETKALELQRSRVQREVDTLARQYEQLMRQGIAANRAQLAQIKKQLDTKSNELEAMK